MGQGSKLQRNFPIFAAINSLRTLRKPHRLLWFILTAENAKAAQSSQRKGE